MNSGHILQPETQKRQELHVRPEGQFLSLSKVSLYSIIGPLCWNTYVNLKKGLVLIAQASQFSLNSRGKSAKHVDVEIESWKIVVQALEMEECWIVELAALHREPLVEEMCLIGHGRWSLLYEIIEGILSIPLSVL